MADGQVVFEISADGKKAYAAINDVTDALKKAGKNWETETTQTTDNIGNKFTSMFSKIGAAALAMKAGKALLDFGKDALAAASDLQEVQNVVDVTFGAGASQIEAWAKTAGDSFGLTELQAKRFTSTMGAMLKSSGLAGDEIIEMSTDLAGLAADMASFYNLDFDTAFQKIRAGISGETEPLKQLGVNLSVANLEAFALQQGLSKTFNEMSSGEQTMLRYQYLMQATADAQGDFARTAESSFANLSRKLQTNIDTIKTGLGNLLIGPAAEVTSWISDMLGSLTAQKPRTILDEIADIDLQTAQKISEIEYTANKAQSLLQSLERLNTNSGLNTDSDVIKYINTLTGDIGGLNTALADGSDIPTNLSELAGGLNPEVSGDISGTLAGITEKIGDLDRSAGSAGSISTNVGDIATALNKLPGTSAAADTLSRIAGGANELGGLTGRKWQSFADALGDIGAGTGGNLQSIADALSRNLSGDADKWEKMLKAIGGNAKAAIDAIGDDDGSKTKAFLANVAESADDLTTDYSPYWTSLLEALGDNAKEAISALAGGDSAGTALGSIADGANGLNFFTGSKWQTFADALGSITDNSPKNLAGIASALSTNLSGDSEKWENLLKAISGNAKAAIEAIGDNDGSKTKEFLANVAASADDLTTDYSPYWTNLLSALGSNAAAAISSLSGGDTAGTALGTIAEGANELGLLAGNKWQGFIDALGGLAGKGDVPTNLAGVASALSANIGGKAGDWEKLLQAVGDNLGDVTSAVGDDNGSTADFLEAAAAAADDLGGDYSTLWTNLLLALGTNAGAAVTALKDATNVGTNLGGIAEGANKLEAGKSLAWSAMLAVLKKVDGLDNIFTSDAAGNVNALATALSTNAPAEDKAAAWQTFLDALGSNAGALNALTGKDAEGAAEWLGAVKDALDKAQLDPNNVQAWSDLLGIFASGLSEDVKGDFTNEIVTQLLAMGSESEYARNALASLGYESDDIANAQKSWLGICKNLVSTIPELSSIINLQTGEIKGGTQAVEEYIKAWKADQILQSQIDNLRQRRAALEQELNVDRIAKVSDARSKAYAMLRQQGISEEEARSTLNTVENGESAKLNWDMNLERGYMYLKIGKTKITDKDTVRAINEYETALRDSAKAEEYINLVLEEQDNILAGLMEQTGKNEDELSGTGEAAETAAKQMSTLERAANDDADALAEVEAAVTQANDAMKALADYQERVREETASSVQSLITGFNEVISPMTKARNELKSWTDELGDTSTTKERREELEKLIEAAKKTENAGPSFQSMQAALDSQLKFMQNYSKELAAARANGISDEILATLSDGSEASFDYLYALNHTLDGLSDEERTERIQELNDTYRQVQETASEFTNTLTDQKLTADEEFKSLVKNVEDAVGGLNMGETTYTYMSNTLNGIISACNDKSAAVKTAVNGIVEQMQRLSSLGAGAWLNAKGRIIFKNASYGTTTDGSQANGLDYVPYDGYLALLHQGERVQTAAEADLARRYSYQQPAFDYNAMGGAIGANIGRGNVYLDGKTVGQVISARQANSYRSLERSGWQG